MRFIILFIVAAFVLICLYAYLRQSGKLRFLNKFKNNDDDEEYIDPSDEDLGFIDREERSTRGNIAEIEAQRADYLQDVSIYRDDLNSCLRDIQIGMPLNYVENMLSNNVNLTDYYVIEESMGQNGLNSVREWYMKGSNIGFQLIIKNGVVVAKKLIK